MAVISALFFTCSAPNMDFIRIDTHIHLYYTNRKGSCEFLDSFTRKSIYYPHLTDEFARTAAPADVKYAVVIEASFQREDNFWLAELVENKKSVKAFIANLDPRDPDFVNDLDSLSHYKKFRGIRIRTKTSIDISTSEVIESLGELQKRNLILEVRGFDPGVIRIARKYPEMQIIVDHLVGLCLIQGKIEPIDWNDYLTMLAAEPNVYCKISALYTISEMNPAPINPNFYKPFIDPVEDQFGSDIVMYGSNWPLSDLRGTYTDLVKMFDTYLEGRSDLTPEKFYCNNALKAFNLSK